MLKLEEYLEEFADLSPEESLEMLVEWGRELPELSPGRAAQELPSECRIQECQTPVYLWVDVRDGQIQLEADVPEKSPTVRGYVALLVKGLAGGTVEDVARLPSDLLPRLGLQGTLGMTREQGFKGILRRIREEIERGVGKRGQSDTKPGVHGKGV